MTKRQLIDQILQVNSTVDPGFLARFEQDELDAYLRHLHQARLPRLAGDPHRFDHYFHDAAKVSWQPAETQAVAVAEPPDDEELHYASDAESDVGGEDAASDDGLYVSEESGALYDAGDMGVVRSANSPVVASADDLDLSYVPAGRAEQSDPPADTQKDSSFADVEEEAEAWLF